MENQFSECAKCGTPINYGEVYVSTTRSVEQAKFDPVTGTPIVTVIDAVGIVDLCGNCGNNFDAETILKTVEAIL